jgi:membrane protein
MNRFIKCIKNLHFRFYDDEIPALGAQLAYYLLLAFFPFLIFLVTLIGYTPVSSDAILRELSNVLPRETFYLIRNNVTYIVSSKNGGLLSFSIIITLWMASNGVGAIVRGLNKAYDEEEIRPFWKLKGMAILFTIALAIIILSSFILLIFGEMIGNYLAQWLGVSKAFHSLWDMLRYIIMLFIMSLVFAALYRYGPNRRLMWREVIPGAIFATLGWIFTSLGFAYYVNNFGNYSKIYGGIGGVIILLIWLFISAMAILLGGELNATLAFDREGKEKPYGKRY